MLGHTRKRTFQGQIKISENKKEENNLALN